jgi:hypothetical protein
MVSVSVAGAISALEGGKRKDSILAEFLFTSQRLESF